jgi:pimeloyl-ACP methyl ester carboxylesterase
MRNARRVLLLAAALGALAFANYAAARRAERRHPPAGRFIEVAGVRLHYSDRGHGQPVVLLHGNIVTGDDFDTSGLVELLLPDHRVVIFDRPGFGYSERPQGRPWNAAEQAELIHAALGRLGVERPIVVGHSWGAILALALAARHQADLAGLVLVSGYYFWSLRLDVPIALVNAAPGLGHLVRYTASPLLGRLTMPLIERALFSPVPIPARFRREYSQGMALRPWQIRASSGDGASMIPDVLRLREHYPDITIPTAILAGDSDRIVSVRSAQRLHAMIPGSRFLLVPGCGHMLHHTAPAIVGRAIREIGESPRQRESQSAMRAAGLTDLEPADAGTLPQRVRLPEPV